MKYIIITLSMTSIERSRFYNSQDQGLGKSLAALGNEVDIYNFVKSKSQIHVGLTDNCTIHYVPSKSFGYHALNRTSFIKNDVDCVVCFSDNQLLFGHIYKLCKKKNIICLPYVGVVGSNNDSRLKSIIMNILVHNTKIYRKTKVLAKTPTVLNNINEYGINDVVLAPICLDEDNLNHEYYKSSVESVKQEMGYGIRDKVLLFIGRLQKEKNPLELLEIFNIISKKDDNYRLIMISSGVMINEVEKRIEEYGLGGKIRLIQKVENSQVWKYYRISNAFINLNTHEIFGMAILEAMYYECMVVAMHAPGPDYIVGNNNCGILCDQFEDISEKIINTHNVDVINKKAHTRVNDTFLWNTTARIINDIVISEMEKKC